MFASTPRIRAYLRNLGHDGSLAGAYLTVAELGFYTDNVTGGRVLLPLPWLYLSMELARPLADYCSSADALQIRLQVAGSAVLSLWSCYHLLTILVLIVVARRGYAPLLLCPYRGER
jgi:ABC-type uncharacterized transport system permease subunit